MFNLEGKLLKFLKERKNDQPTQCKICLFLERCKNLHLFATENINECQFPWGIFNETKNHKFYYCSCCNINQERKYILGFLLHNKCVKCETPNAV